MTRHRSHPGRTAAAWTALALAAVVLPAVGAQSASPPDPTPQPPAQTPVQTPPATGTPDAQGGTITGHVHAAVAAPASGKTAPAGAPLPGVTITATNTLTGKKYAAATDVNGTYRLLIPRNGRYVVRAEFAAFAPLTAEVLLNADHHQGSAEFVMELASRAAARAASSGVTEAANALGLSNAQTQSLARGLQSLRGAGSDALSAGDASGAAGVSLPSLGGVGGDTAGSDAVAVNGQAGQTTGLANFNEDEIRERIDNAIAQARRNGGQEAQVADAVVGLIGSLGGFGGGPGGGNGRGARGGAAGRSGGGFGSFRNFDPTKIHGNLFFSGGNGALDATRFSLTDNPVQPAYSTNRYGLNLAGSPYIPGLFKASTKNFAFINLTGGRNSNPVYLYGTVPTDAERIGDFSGFTRVVNGVPAVVTLYDPLTGQPFANNVIPQSRLSPEAVALLNYYPHANQATTGATPTAQNYNYQRITTAGQNSAQLAARFVRNFGADTGRGGGGGFFGGGGGRGNRDSATKTLRQNANANFSYSHSASDLRNFSAVLDSKSASDGYNLGVGYSIGYGRLNNNASLTWNRSHSATTNYFTGGVTDPGAGLNIPKPASLTPGFYNGVPGLQLTNFTGLNQVDPSDRVQQTISWGDQMRWNHKRHNMSFGFQVRHVENNVIGATDVLGSFGFSGLYTQQPGVTTSSASTGVPTGSSFADFLLGAPQNSRIQAGSSKIHLRELAYNIYANDDWRARANLTVNAGLRYEYFGPYTEINNQLVNLDHSADFLSVAPVIAGGRGPYSGAFPHSLVNADHTLFLPTMGIAYRPTRLKNTVIRAGYGISYNSGQYGSFANSLSYQQPFATTQTNVAYVGNNDPGCGTFTAPGTVNHSRYTLTTAFSCSAQSTSNNFAVNRDYRLGRVQVVNAGIQHTFGLGILLNVDYNGSFGGNLDLLRAPGRNAQDVFVGNSQPYTYEDSVAESRGHFLLVNVRKRMSKGVSLQAAYRYGHSIDNASSVGGTGGNTVVQNDARLDLEFGNSSLDLRHQLTGSFVAELPFGPNRALLHNGGFWAGALDGFSLSGNYNFATGSYATPQFANTSTQQSTGNNVTLRPDRVFTQRISGAGTLRNWVNAAAFTPPVNVYGTSSRNSIELPGTVSFDMSLSKTVSFGEIKNFEARVTATNAFNTVQYSGVDTVFNSATFGQVTGVSNPRKLQLQARYRF